MSSDFDHFLWGVPDLDDGIAQFSDMTGVQPIIGGSHPGIGTRNALASLGANIYFEIIAPDPAQQLEGTLGEEIGSLQAPSLMTMALRAPDLAGIAAIYTAHGIEVDQSDEGRRTPDGDMLSWSLCEPRHEMRPMDPRWPFYIDWKNTPHPSSVTPIGCQFKSISFSGPDAAEIKKLWRALGVPARFDESDKYNVALLIDTPEGEIRFDGVF
ncbi:MAG: VOC family protein [Pseudomonadota bacterium]